MTSQQILQLHGPSILLGSLAVIVLCNIINTCLAIRRDAREVRDQDRLS